MRSVIIAGSRTVSPTVEQITEAISTLDDANMFEPAWKVMEERGYQYGEDILAGVRFGWEMRTNLWGAEDWTEIVSGRAPGADRAGEAWAKANGKSVHEEPITAELVKQYGKYLAPKMRNRLMAERADGCIVFWDGTSGGTADMVCRMVARGKPVKVFPWPKAKGVRRGGR